MRKGFRTAALLLAAVCLFICTCAAADTMHKETDHPAFDMQVTVGYDGMMTFGKTMPVKVRIHNSGGDFEGKLGLNAYATARQYDRYEMNVYLPAGSEREFVLTPAVFAKQDVYTVELTRDGEVLCAVNAEAETQVNPSALLIAVLSTRPQNLKNLCITRENDVLSRYEMWQTVPLTRDSFPEDPALMKSFAMLVIDDVDPASLSTKQQECLNQWLTGGRIVICGGGSAAIRNAAYFSGYTGLSLSEVTTSDSVPAGLERMVGRTGNRGRPEVALAVYDGGEPLARDEGGRGLVYRSEAGAGRIYTAAFETGDPLLNSESLMHYFWQQALIDHDPDLYNSVLYLSASDTPTALVNGGYSTPIRARSMMLPGILIVAGTLLLACIFWAVLKRKDLSRWMWALIPVLSLAASAGILLLSHAAETNRPMAVVTENLVQDSAGVTRNYSTIAVASPTYGIHGYSMGSDTLRVQNFDYVDYSEDEDGERTEPDLLRTCYISGGENTVMAESVEPWDQISLVAEKDAGIRGQVKATVWMEEDGLHGEVRNDTDLTFGPGHIITSYGYASVPLLAPGDTAPFLLAKRTVADPRNPVYEDGGLYLGSELNLYSVISLAVGYDQSGYQDYYGAVYTKREAALCAMITNAAEQLRRGQNAGGYYTVEAEAFLYSAEPQNPVRPDLRADGETVEQSEFLTCLTAEAAFSTVGRTGVVFRSAGMDLPVRVETDENMMPGETLELNEKTLYYHSLSDTPTFRFDLKGMEGVRAELLQVKMDSYYAGQAKAYALNAVTRQWEEITLNEDLQDPARYLDEKGRLYLQFRGTTQEMYAEISTPMIMLEGRLDHAEN